MPDPILHEVVVLRPQDPDAPSITLISDAEVTHRTSLSKKVRLELESRGEFPRRVPLTPKSTGYVESEIDLWLMDRVAEREAATRRRQSPNRAARRASS